MKIFSKTNLTYKSLAKLLITTKSNVYNYVNRGDIDPDDIESVCKFYRSYGPPKEREEQWKQMYKDYITLRLHPADKETVEKMLKEWGEEDKIRKSKLF